MSVGLPQNPKFEIPNQKSQNVISKDWIRSEFSNPEKTLL